MLRSSSVNLTERMLLGMSDSGIESLERENVVPLTAVMLRTLCSVTEPGIKLRGSTVSLNESSRKELSKLNVKFRRVGANRSGVNFFTCLPLPLEIEITSTPLTSVIESEVTVKKVVSNVSASSRVASFVIDDRSPSLAAFVLDLNTNTLILTFSETISVSSLDLNKIFLRSGQNTFSEEYVFTGGDKPSLDSPIVNVLLTLDDSNAIRANRILAIDESSTFLQISTDAFQDAAGNIGTPLGISQAIQGSFIADVTGPTIDSYVLDLSLNTLILNFSETVDPLTFNPLLFTFQSSRANSISSRTLTGGALTSPNPSPILTLNLLSPDIVTLKTYRICYKRFS